VSKKKEQMVRFQWIEDDTMLDEYFELKIKIDDMTGELALIVTDFAEQGEEDDQKMLWDEAIEELRRHIGC
ncbi:MAG: START-like domain-containing protein, partial [Flavobacteriales bacterium]